jgi:hypothetical protein
MSRDDGFGIADVDTGFYSDPKVVALARRLRDPMVTAAHLTAYEALVLASWRAGARIMLSDAMPAWWLEPADDVLANLVAVELVDDDGRLPERVFEAWFRPAWNRRESARSKGRKGGRAHAQAVPDSGSAQAQPEPSLSPTGAELNPSVPSVPSVPTDPSVARARANGDGRPKGKTNGRDLASCPGCGDELHTGDPGVRAERGGQMRHETCPTAIAVATA